jgi:hypothetical protein
MEENETTTLPKTENPNRKKAIGAILIGVGVIALIMILTKKKDEKQAIVVNVNNGDKTPKKKAPKKPKAKKNEKADSKDESGDNLEDNHELSDELPEDDNSDDNNEGEE